MKKSELIKLKKELLKEIERRKKIEELLNKIDVQEFLSLTKINYYMIDSSDERTILSEILENFEVSESNGILVCTGTYAIIPTGYYEDDDYKTIHADFDSKYADFRIYTDIENGQKYKAYFDTSLLEYRNCYNISQFEKDNIVLNPYNTYKDNNGYDEVRLEYFYNSVHFGQPKSKKILLEKYPRI